MKIISKENINREVEQDRRYLTYQRDRESLEVCKIESDETFTEKYRIDNLLTNGVYFVEQDGKKLICTCPDYLNRCSDLSIRCKHILAVENWKARKEQAGTMKESEKFNPQNYLIKVKGKDYLEVKFRLHWFRQEKALWDIRTEIIKLDTDRGIAVVRADIYDEKGNHRSSGLSMETMKNFQDYLEKAETSATGRALAALGYGTLQSVELDEGKIVDSPVKIGGNKGNNGSNGKIEVQVFKPAGNNGNGKISGNNGTKQAEEEDGKPKASLQQVRYIKDLCKNLKIEPKMYVPGLSRAQASKMIEDLQGEIERRKKAKE
jgi:hypothetical protein